MKPTFSLPKVNLPKVNLPKVNLPKVNLPKVNLPKVNLGNTLSSVKDKDIFHLPSAHYVAGTGNILTVTCILLAIVSLSTDHWTVVTVDRKGLQVLANNKYLLNVSLHTDPNYYTRTRGIFRTCYSGEDLQWLKSYQPKDHVTGGNCLKEAQADHFATGPSYNDRINLLRSHVAMQVLGFLVLLVTTVFGLMGCYYYSVTAMRTSAIMAFIASLLLSSAMAFFHGYEYLEKQTLDAHHFYKSWIMDVPLRDFSKYEYGYSYNLGWVGAMLALVTAIFFLVSSHLIVADRHNFAEDQLYNEYLDAERRKVPRNLAYDYIEYGYTPGGDTSTPQRKMTQTG